MIVKRLLTLVALLTVIAGSVALAAPAAAQDGLPASEAAQYCRERDTTGDLGITRGECINANKGPSSKDPNKANNFAAGLCGDKNLQAATGGNKGQCIKGFRDL